jgi:glycosyltransferase involved in cell wall biosynthesis
LSPHEELTTQIRADFQAEVTALRLANHFTELTSELGRRVDETEVMGIMSLCDIIMATSISEGFFLPALEGIACRRPVLVPDLVPVRSWAEDRIAYYAPEAPAGEIAQLIASLAEGAKDAWWVRAEWAWSRWFERLEALEGI